MKILLLVISMIAVYLIIGLLFVRLFMWPRIGDPTSYDSLYDGLRDINGLLSQGCDEMEEDMELGEAKRTLVTIAEIMWTIFWIPLAIIYLMGTIKGIIIGLFTKKN